MKTAKDSYCHDGRFTIEEFSKTGFTTTTESNWNNCKNILNVDIDDNGDLTNINFEVDIDKLRNTVFEFRTYVKTWQHYLLNCSSILPTFTAF